MKSAYIAPLAGIVLHAMNAHAQDSALPNGIETLCGGPYETMGAPAIPLVEGYINTIRSRAAANPQGIHALVESAGLQEGSVQVARITELSYEDANIAFALAHDQVPYATIEDKAIGSPNPAIRIPECDQLYHNAAILALELWQMKVDSSAR